jgi:Na+/H+ antiporter NhaD/arsenite permease-like protein
VNLVSSLYSPIIAITFLGIAAGEYPSLKMNRTTIALVGAVALVAPQIIPLSAALAAIDPNTLLLLFAMRIISPNFRLDGFFIGVGQFIARHACSSRRLLAWIVLAAGVLSALCLNNAVVVISAPLAIDVTRALRRNPLFYLVGLAAAVRPRLRVLPL